MVKGELILNWLNTLFTSESPHEKHCSSKRSLFGKPTMNDQLIVSAQKFPLSTSRVCHAYSEDNIRKLRSLFQRSLACIVMVPSVDTNGLHGFFFSPYGIIIIANVYGFNRKNFYQNVLHIFVVLHSTGTLGPKIHFI